MSDGEDISLPLVSRRGVSLTTRILAVNVFVLGLIASSLLYLDSYRNELLAERMRQAGAEIDIAALALSGTQPTAPSATGVSGVGATGVSPATADLMVRIGAARRVRLRLFTAQGVLLADSFSLSPRGPAFTLVDPASERFYIKAARLLDRGMDALLGDPPVGLWREPPPGTAATASLWPEIATAARTGGISVRERYAPDRTPVITAALALPAATPAAAPAGAGAPAPAGASAGAPAGPPHGLMLLTERNDRDITSKVREARQNIADVVGLALLVSVFLSLFLARTIVNPLRLLVRAAVRVRLGREREVVVPRLPQRRDEIGLLARAFSDMTTALRQRIDAVESFAADVAHEIKNPLASLRSALDVLDTVEQPDLRRQLLDIAAHDVQRIDRLITEIADASRIDAELSRTTFVPVDMLALAAALVGARSRRPAHDPSLTDQTAQDSAKAPVRLRVRQDGDEAPVVPGDPARLERVLENLLDNAISFSPPGGVVDVVVAAHGGRVAVVVSDDGPGIAPDARERVFERFHSLRPEAEDFGRHSGLGLAIARTIVEAHQGTLTARDPQSPRLGARLVVDLPAWRQ